MASLTTTVTAADAAAAAAAATENSENPRFGEAATVDTLSVSLAKASVGMAATDTAVSADAIDGHNDSDLEATMDVLFQGLDQFLSGDTTRLTLKWEGGSSRQRILMGTNTHLPMSRNRECFALELPPAAPPSPESPRHEDDEDDEGASSSVALAKKLLFRLVTTIVRLSPKIRQLDLEGFGRECASSNSSRTNHNNHEPESSGESFDTPVWLDIEDVFEAFANEPDSSWRTGDLAVVRTMDCDMNSSYGNQTFSLARDEFPKGLEEIYVYSPKGSVLSSSIFRIAQEAPKLVRVCVFCGYNPPEDAAFRGPGRIASVSSRPTASSHHRFHGSHLTPAAIDAVCRVLSSRNRLLEINQLPFRELVQLSSDNFTRVLRAIQATAATEESPSLSANPLRFPVTTTRPGKPPYSNLTMLATRSEALKLYLLWKRSLELLRDESRAGLAPWVLRRSQRQKSIRSWIPSSNHDLLFAMLQDSLVGLLGASTVNSTEPPGHGSPVASKP